MDARMPSMILVFRALANSRRLTIMGWLMDPTAHFPPQRDGDLVEDGVCVGFITEKIGLSQPTVTTHMQILADAGLVTSKKIRNWAFYKVNHAQLETFIEQFGAAFGDKRL